MAWSAGGEDWVVLSTAAEKINLFSRQVHQANTERSDFSSQLSECYDFRVCEFSKCSQNVFNKLSPIIEENAMILKFLVRILLDTHYSQKVIFLSVFKECNE